jgi:translocation and assembly module TamB
LKRWAWTLCGVLGLLAALAGGAAWLLATPEGFRWLVTQAAAASGGKLNVEGVDGHLGAPLSIRWLGIVTDTQRIEVENLRLEWQPRALVQRRLEVDLLAAQVLRVTLVKKDPAPPELPVTLRLPVDVAVRTLDLARLEWVDAGQMWLLRDLRGRLDDDGTRYRLSNAQAQTPWVGVTGELDIAKDAPFALGATLEAERREPVPLGARLALEGTLAAPQFRLDATATGMHGFAQGELAPFAAVRLRRLVVAGEGLDPRFFAADAPAADFAFSGVFEGQVGERLLGTFSLANRKTGRLDQRRLPLASLTGAVFGDFATATFSELAIDLGAAGKLVGDGAWRDGRVTFDLASPRLDFAGLHRDLYATKLAATLRLTGDAAQQTLDAEVRESWGQGRVRLHHADAVLRLETASFQGEAGRLDAHGDLRLDATRAFAVAFEAARINPARFGRFPRGRLNLRGEASGALAPAPHLAAQFTLPPGDLDGRPVRGQGRLRYADAHLADADLDVELAGNRARARGAYGRSGDRLDWELDAPALARLGFGLAGRARGHGHLAGEPERPQIVAQLSGSGLRVPGNLAADTLSVDLDLQADAAGPFNGLVEARGFALGDQRLSFLRARVQGRRDAHALTLDARLPEWRLTAALTGGLDAAQTWRGQLAEADLHGPWPATLATPAALILSRQRQQVDGLALDVAGGQLRLAHFSFDAAGLVSRGELANLPLAPLQGLLPTAVPFTTDLRVDGDWDLRLGERADGQLKLRRRAGDVRLEAPALDVGLTRLTLDLTAQASRVAARVEAASREAGQFYAEGAVTLVRDGGFWTLPRSAPLAWTARFDVSDLRLVRPFLPLGVRADARLDAELAGSGSLAAPRVDGRIAASAMRFSMPEEGILIRDGHLELALADDRVRVTQGELAGSAGRVVVSGEAELRNPKAGLDLVFEQFVASNRSDRRITVSGATRLALDPQRMQLTGALTADRARLEVPEATRPALSGDVVVAGRLPPERTKARQWPLDFDLDLGLGRDFLFKGAGLDVRLGGQLRVFTREQRLRGEGTIRVEDGRYAAYGQTLAIERGVLRFIGPLDDPGLDVLAVRTTPTVKAGVQVRGTVQRPQVTLYSDPPLPDTEKLAWLVLGHGLDKGGQQEFALLQLAAGALLSQAESVSFQAQLAEALRIDTFGVRAGEGEDLGSTVVSVGKRLSSRATLSYEQSVDGLNQVVKVLYQLSPRVRLEAQAGEQSSFDAFYTREYD